MTLWLFFHVASSAFADPHQWPLIPEASELNPPSSKNTRALLDDLERNGRLDSFDEIKVISHVVETLHALLPQATLEQRQELLKHQKIYQEKIQRLPEQSHLLYLDHLITFDQLAFGPKQSREETQAVFSMLASAIPIIEPSHADLLKQQAAQTLFYLFERTHDPKQLFHGIDWLEQLPASFLLCKAYYWVSYETPSDDKKEKLRWGESALQCLNALGQKNKNTRILAREIQRYLEKLRQELRNDPLAPPELSDQEKQYFLKKKIEEELKRLEKTDSMTDRAKRRVVEQLLNRKAPPVQLQELEAIAPLLSAERDGDEAALESAISVYHKTKKPGRLKRIYIKDEIKTAVYEKIQSHQKQMENLAKTYQEVNQKQRKQKAISKIKNISIDEEELKKKGLDPKLIETFVTFLEKLKKEDLEKFDLKKLEELAQILEKDPEPSLFGEFLSALGKELVESWMDDLSPETLESLLGLIKTLYDWGLIDGSWLKSIADALDLGSFEFPSLDIDWPDWGFDWFGLFSSAPEGVRDIDYDFEAYRSDPSKISDQIWWSSNNDRILLRSENPKERQFAYAYLLKAAEVLLSQPLYENPLVYQSGDLISEFSSPSGGKNKLPSAFLSCYSGAYPSLCWLDEVKDHLEKISSPTETHVKLIQAAVQILDHSFQWLEKRYQNQRHSDKGKGLFPLLHTYEHIQMLLFQVRTFEDIYKKFKDHVSLSIPWKQLKQKWHQTAQRHLQNLYAGERYRSWDEAALRFFQVAKSANSVLASLPLTLKEKQNYFARLSEWIPQHPLSAEERKHFFFYNFNPYQELFFYAGKQKNLIALYRQELKNRGAPFQVRSETEAQALALHLLLTEDLTLVDTLSDSELTQLYRSALLTAFEFCLRVSPEERSFSFLFSPGIALRNQGADDGRIDKYSPGFAEVIFKFLKAVEAAQLEKEDLKTAKKVLIQEIQFLEKHYRKTGFERWAKNITWNDLLLAVMTASQNSAKNDANLEPFYMDLIETTLEKTSFHPGQLEKLFLSTSFSSEAMKQKMEEMFLRVIQQWGRRKNPPPFSHHGHGGETPQALLKRKLPTLARFKETYKGEKIISNKAFVQWTHELLALGEERPSVKTYFELALALLPDESIKRQKLSAAWDRAIQKTIDLQICQNNPPSTVKARLPPFFWFFKGFFSIYFFTTPDSYIDDENGKTCFRQFFRETIPYAYSAYVPFENSPEPFYETLFRDISFNGLSGLSIKGILKEDLLPHPILNLLPFSNFRNGLSMLIETEIPALKHQVLDPEMLNLLQSSKSSEISSLLPTELISKAQLATHLELSTTALNHAGASFALHHFNQALEFSEKFSIRYLPEFHYVSDALKDADPSEETLFTHYNPKETTIPIELSDSESLDHPMRILNNLAQKMDEAYSFERLDALYKEFASSPLRLKILMDFEIEKLNRALRNATQTRDPHRDNLFYLKGRFLSWIERVSKEADLNKKQFQTALSLAKHWEKLFYENFPEKLVLPIGAWINQHKEKLTPDLTKIEKENPELWKRLFPLEPKEPHPLLQLPRAQDSALKVLAWLNEEVPNLSKESWPAVIEVLRAWRSELTSRMFEKARVSPVDFAFTLVDSTLKLKEDPKALFSLDSFIGRFALSRWLEVASPDEDLPWKNMEVLGFYSFTRISFLNPELWHRVALEFPEREESIQKILNRKWNPFDQASAIRLLHVPFLTYALIEQLKHARALSYDSDKVIQWMLHLKSILSEQTDPQPDYQIQWQIQWVLKYDLPVLTRKLKELDLGAEVDLNRVRESALKMLGRLRAPSE